MVDMMAHPSTTASDKPEISLYPSPAPIYLHRYNSKARLHYVAPSHFVRQQQKAKPSREAKPGRQIKKEKHESTPHDINIPGITMIPDQKPLHLPRSACQNLSSSDSKNYFVNIESTEESQKSVKISTPEKQQEVDDIANELYATPVKQRSTPSLVARFKAPSERHEVTTSDTVNDPHGTLVKSTKNESTLLLTASNSEGEKEEEDGEPPALNKKGVATSEPSPASHKKGVATSERRPLTKLHTVHNEGEVGKVSEPGVIVTKIRKMASVHLSTPIRAPTIPAIGFLPSFDTAVDQKKTAPKSPSWRDRSADRNSAAPLASPRRIRKSISPNNGFLFATAPCTPTPAPLTPPPLFADRDDTQFLEGTLFMPALALSHPPSTRLGIPKCTPEEVSIVTSRSWDNATKCSSNASTRVTSPTHYSSSSSSRTTMPSPVRSPTSSQGNPHANVLLLGNGENAARNRCRLNTAASWSSRTSETSSPGGGGGRRRRIASAPLYAERRRFRTVVPVRVFLDTPLDNDYDDNDDDDDDGQKEVGKGDGRFPTQYDSFITMLPEQERLYARMFDKATSRPVKVKCFI